MATKTLGTVAATSLTAINFSQAVTDADFATIAAAIINDANQAAIPGTQIWPGAFARTGLLYIPNRGVLRAQPGDWVGVDHSGWPILVSADAIADAGSSWSHS